MIVERDEVFSLWLRDADQTRKVRAPVHCIVQLNSYISYVGEGDDKYQYNGSAMFECTSTSTS